MKDLFKVMFFIILFVLCIVVIRTCASGISDAGSTINKEFNASALLKKYEWFKSSSSQLEKKVADIRIYEKKLLRFKEEYGDKARINWARDDREQYNIWISEMDGIKMSYNQLASEYNANMVKFNYRFTNVGDMPDGSSTPLPKEYKPYIEQ